MGCLQSPHLFFLDNLSHFPFVPHFDVHLPHFRVSLPSQLQTLGDSAFFRAKRLRGLTLPATMRHIGCKIVERCESLKQSPRRE